MIVRLALFVWIAGCLLAAFLWAPLVPVLGETTRVLYFHIPCAWVTVLALGWSMVHSVLYLSRRRIEHDDQAAGAAELGLMFCVAATVSGSVWAKAMWGSYWNWDPRETSIFFLMRARWILTVFSAMPSFAAICLFMRPSTTWAKTSSSRRVSDAMR